MGIQVTYFGHSCFVCEAKGYQISIDPYDGHVPGYAPLALEANEVVCSHGHTDHSYIAAVKLLDGGPSSFSVSRIKIPHDDAGGSVRGMNTIHVFECDGIRIAHFGDIGCHPNEKDMGLLRGLDAAMLPVGGTYTIDAGQARALADELNVRVVIPMHYRLGKLGFEATASLDSFLALSHDTVRYAGNQIHIMDNMTPQTAILKYLAI